MDGRPRMWLFRRTTDSVVSFGRGGRSTLCQVWAESVGSDLASVPGDWMMVMAGWCQSGRGLGIRRE